jgi:uncharacterized protein with PQ loop repeat
MLYELGIFLNVTGTLGSFVGSYFNATSNHVAANMIWFCNSAILFWFFFGVALHIFVLDGSAWVNASSYLFYCATNLYYLLKGNHLRLKPDPLGD